MSFLRNPFGGNDDHAQPENRLEIAEQHIREDNPLFRHYCIPEVRTVVKQFTDVALTDNETVSIVQRIRDEKEMGPIEDYNMPKHSLLSRLFQ